MPRVGNDRFPVGLDVGKKRQPLDELLFEERRLRGLLFDPGHRDLADLERIGRDQPEEGREWKPDRQQENQQGQRGDERPPSRHLLEQPGVERKGQSAENGAEDQGDEEALDHVEKDRRDGDCEKKEETLAVEILVAGHGWPS